MIATYLNKKCSENMLPETIRRLALTLGIGYYQLEKFIIFDLTPDCPYQKIPGKIRVYLEIENEFG